jgi:hypothetical protein
MLIVQSLLSFDCVEFWSDLKSWDKKWKSFKSLCTFETGAQIFILTIISRKGNSADRVLKIVSQTAATSKPMICPVPQALDFNYLKVRALQRRGWISTEDIHRLHLIAFGTPRDEKAHITAVHYALKTVEPLTRCMARDWPLVKSNQPNNLLRYSYKTAVFFTK